MAREKVGIIGLGAMGKPMALNLLKGGFEVFAFDIRKEPLEELEASGAHALTCPHSVATHADRVITILPSSRDVQESILGQNGMIATLREGKILIEMSTISPLVTQELAGHVEKTGAKMIDGPVSGGGKGAEEGTLTIMVGGDTEVFEQCRPILMAVGKNVHHVGAIGMGETVKMLNQLLVGVNLIGVCETVGLASKLGVNLEQLYEILRTSAGRSMQLESKMPMIVSGSYDTAFKIDFMEKDLGYAVEMARDVEFPLIFGGLAHTLFLATQAERGKNGVEAMMNLFEAIGNVKLQKSL
ncbi:MAG: NAD(P)-dependent oxidoreductase [Deltaproteobacteria bacterium]|nr:NAD(P)-dependent oxidoreductase [Deltaproteobacteria bacterium]